MASRNLLPLGFPPLPGYFSVSSAGSLFLPNLLALECPGIGPLSLNTQTRELLALNTIYVLTISTLLSPA